MIRSWIPPSNGFMGHRGVYKMRTIVTAAPGRPSVSLEVRLTRVLRALCVVDLFSVIGALEEGNYYTSDHA